MNDEPCVCDTDFTCLAEHAVPTPYIHVGSDGSHLCVLPRSHWGSCWAPCGGPMHTGNESHPPADICNQCAPRPCDTCGGTEHPDDLCGCWTDLTAVPTADVKAMFAADGWNVGTDGRLAR